MNRTLMAAHLRAATPRRPRLPRGTGLLASLSILAGLALIALGAWGVR